jgi:adenosylcobinamide-phosphate synthase
MSGLFVLVLAAGLDAVLGEPRWLWSRAPHPAVLMGRLLSALERLFYADSRLAGLWVLALAVAIAIGLGWALSTLGPVAEVICAAILLAHRSLVDHVQRVADALRMSLAEGRAAVEMIVSRDTGEMTEAQVARAAIESAAENMSDGVIAPAFWFALAGLPGLLLYKMVNTADSMIGYRTPRYERFGWAAARLDDVLNWVPARLTGAAFWLVGERRGTWPDIAAEARRHKSPNAGWPEAALARALGIALAGPRVYHGQLQDLPWVNPAGRRDLRAADIEAAIRRLWHVWAFFVILCLTAAILL